MQTTKYEIEIKLTEPMLGTVPKNKEVYTSFVAGKVLAMANGEEKAEEEIQTVQEIEEKGWTGHHKDEKGLFIYDYMIRGFLKTAAKALKPQLEVKAYKSHIDTEVFVFPRKIHFLRNGKTLQEPDGVLERPLRAQTMQGPRVTLAKSDLINSGTNLKFILEVLPGSITEKTIKTWLDYGRFSGLGQFRNGSYGRFEIVKFE